MSDFFVLRMLQQPFTVLDKQYKVVWEKDHAKVYYTQVGEDAWEPLSPIFDSELDAHAYLNLLASLNFKPDNNWRKL